MKKKKIPLIYLGVGVVAIVLAIIGFTSNSHGKKPALIENGYYNGPMVNKNGDLVDGDGTMIKRGYAPERAQKRLKADLK